jgi:CRP-like cAMP-binding protein
VVGPAERFGVIDILSGRPRTAEAVAMTGTRAVKIDAEDFFDLLSNNIEIVKALFRKLVAHGEPVAELEV